MTNIKGATRHVPCYGKYGISKECLLCVDTMSCFRAKHKEDMRQGETNGKN